MMLLTDITKIEYKNPVTMVSNACGIYVDFKRPLSLTCTVNHMILDKLAHYGVRGIENNWFKTYLTREWSNI